MTVEKTVPVRALSRRSTLAIGGLALALGLGLSPAQAQQTVKVGLILPMTGPLPRRVARSRPPPGSTWPRRAPASPARPSS